MIFFKGIDPNNLLGSRIELDLISSHQQGVEIDQENSNLTPENIANINLSYQYEDQDIDSILRLRVQEENLNLNDTIIMPPFHNHFGGLEALEAQLNDEISRYRHIVGEGEIPHERTILIPLNINGNHWVGLVVRIPVIGRLSITYIDSLGNNIPKDVAKSLRNVYGNNINIKNKVGLLQIDSTSCGPLMIENLIRAAKGGARSEMVSNSIILKVRAHHVDLAERYDPMLMFKKRQQNNIRSFRGITGGLIVPDISLGTSDSV